MAASALSSTDRTAGTLALVTARRAVLLLVLLGGVLATIVLLTGGAPAAVPTGDGELWVTTDWEVRSPHADALVVTAV